MDGETKDTAEAPLDDLQVLKEAKDRARKKVSEDPSAANLVAFDRASKMFAAHLAGQETNSAAFKNRLDVVRYLQNQGYKCQKSKLYKDADSGILKIQPDGTILEASVQKYIANPRSGLIKKSSEEPYETSDEIRRRISAECRLAEVKASKAEMEMEVESGKWILRKDFEMEVAARTAIMEVSLRNLGYTRFSDYMATGKVIEARDMFFSDLDAMLNELASLDNFQVLFQEE